MMDQETVVKGPIVQRTSFERSAKEKTKIEGLVIKDKFSEYCKLIQLQLNDQE